MPNAYHLQFIKSTLRNGGLWTAGVLAEKLECNERTVRRCMDHLRDAEKWPIDSGKLGYSLREASVAETRITDPREVAALVMADEALRKLGSSELAGRIRAELMAVCQHSADLGNAGWQNLNNAIQERSASGEAVMNKAIHGQLTLAILQRQITEIRYRKLECEEGFLVRIFPHKWFNRDLCWYLLAEDLQRGGQRVYALPRISQAKLLPRPAEFKEPIFEDQHEHAFGIWTTDKDAPLHEVCVELTDYWARIARERHWHPSQRLEDLAPNRVRVHFRLNELVEVKSWVLKFGGAATVISPAKLRNLVREELKQMERNYES